MIYVRDLEEVAGAAAYYGNCAITEEESEKYELCRTQGHNWKDDGGYCNGDGAADYFVCSRCGATWTHTWF